MTPRLVPAVAAGVILGVAGMRQAALLRRQTALLCRWERLLRHLLLLIRTSPQSLPEVLEQAACEASEPDRLLRSLACSLRQKPLCSLSEFYALMPAADAAHPVLLRLFSRLDRGSRELRVQAVEQAAEEIGILAKESGVKTSRDARMWTQLGWAAGACAALLLI